MCEGRRSEQKKEVEKIKNQCNRHRKEKERFWTEEDERKKEEI